MIICIIEKQPDAYNINGLVFPLALLLAKMLGKVDKWRIGESRGLGEERQVISACSKE